MSAAGSVKTPRLIAVLCPPGEDPSEYRGALEGAGATATVASTGGLLPHGVAGLLIAGHGASSGRNEKRYAITSALESDIPVFGIGWGMYAINEAMGGAPAVPVVGHIADGAAPVRHAVFLSPGGKVSHAIGGSGWVNVPCAHTHGLRAAHVASGLLASAYARDGVVEAVELPGRPWVIGVQWRAHMPQELPKGFENLLLSFIERVQAS